jgi:hypothetical protein
MATKEQLDTLAKDLLGLPPQVDLCGQVANALIEIGEPQAKGSLFGKASDYQRARRQVQRALSTLQVQIHRLRRKTLSPDLIRADHRLLGLRSCCARCPQANAEGFKAQQPFQCLIKQHGGRDALAPMRFTLDENGGIHERP